MLLYKNHEQMHQFSTQLIYFTHKMSSNDALSSKILHLKTLSHTCAVCYANHYVDHGCEICWCWVQLLLQDLTMAQHDDISICQQLLHLCYQPLSKLRSTTLLMDLREATSWGVGNLSCEEVWAEWSTPWLQNCFTLSSVPWHIVCKIHVSQAFAEHHASMHILLVVDQLITEHVISKATSSNTSSKHKLLLCKESRTLSLTEMLIQTFLWQIKI